MSNTAEQIEANQLLRYEELRQLCLRQANIHPADPATCSYALERTPRMHPIAIQLASLLDDMILLIKSRPTPNAGLSGDVAKLLKDDLQMLIDMHDANESEADGFDMPDQAKYHREKRIGYTKLQSLLAYQQSHAALSCNREGDK